MDRFRSVSSLLCLAGVLTMFMFGSVMGEADSTGSKKAKPEADSSPAFVILKTSMGDIELELNREKAPISVANFLNYADRGAYDGTIFHRVIGNFMIQGGGFDKDMVKRPTDAGIENEWKNGLKNVKYSIAMARLGGQANSGTNQFFINVSDNAGLDSPRDGAGYAVFGKVVKGMEVVDAIKAVKTTSVDGMQNVPVEPVLIEKVTRPQVKVEK